MVRDLIAGIFILAENQYRTGDVVTVAGTSGLVESINLRRTVLRDLDGQVIVIPNGEISVAFNKTKYWSRVNLDIGVAYKEDVDRVVEVLNEVGEEIAADPYYGLMLITPPQVLRLDALDDSAVTFKMLGDCKPMKQWEITGEMRRRIKIRLDNEGIEIPFPHQTVYWGEAQPPFRYEGTNEGKQEIRSTESNLGTRSSTGKGAPTETRTPDPIDAGAPITPERREELLATIALATNARMDESDWDVRARTLIVDLPDNE